MRDGQGQEGEEGEGEEVGEESEAEGEEADDGSHLSQSSRGSCEAPGPKHAATQVTSHASQATGRRREGEEEGEGSD